MAFAVESVCDAFWATIGISFDRPVSSQPATLMRVPVPDEQDSSASAFWRLASCGTIVCASRSKSTIDLTVMPLRASAYTGDCNAALHGSDATPAWASIETL